jgi:TetR/AcrR family tetracycline transcriptional repressor
MNHQDKITRDLARLEEAQNRAQERLAAQQVRINKRFEHMRGRLNRKYGEPSEGQQRIIDAALTLLREDGLNNLSLRKLASRVNMQAPALYWHFKSKDVLVDYMAEAILSKVFKDLKPRKLDEDWQVWLSDKMLKLRMAMLAFPDGARVVAGAHLYPAVSLGALFEYTLESLLSAGIDSKTSRLILMTVTTYTFGFVIEEQASPNPQELDMLQNKGQAFFSSYPHLVQVAQEAHQHKRSFGEDYITGLQYILKGSTTS